MSVLFPVLSFSFTSAVQSILRFRGERTNMDELKKMKWLCIITEAVWLVLCFCFFYWVKYNYGTATAYDEKLFRIFLLGFVFLAWLFGPLLNRYIVLLYGFVYTGYLVSQTAYNRAFHSYYRFNMALDLAGEVSGVKSSAAEFLTGKDIFALIFWLVLNIVFIILYFRLQRPFWKQVSWKKKLVYHLTSLVLLFHISSNCTKYQKDVAASKDDLDLLDLNHSEYYIYMNIPTAIQFVDHYGILSLGVRDAELFSGKSQPLEIDYESMIDEFLAKREDQKSNDYTGLFAGKNVMFIQAESFNHITLDEELTPTLYMMYENSLRVEGFNTPALPGSTSDTEFMANTSLIPDSAENPACYNYAGNTYPVTLPKMFNEHGYWTAAYHNNYGEYYNRSEVFPNLGYDDFLDCTAMGLQDTSTDTSVEERIKWNYAGVDVPWMAYWITFSGHQPYGLDSVGVSEGNVARIKEKYPEMADQYVSYLAKNMDLDQAMENMIETLKEYGNLDNVVFIFFGDHIAKGMDYSGSSDIWTNFEKTADEKEYFTDLYFYNSASEPQVYEKTATVLDFIPTIANLWGFEINTHEILGHDIFDPDYSGFYFDEWSTWRTDNFIWYFTDDEYVLFYDYSEDKAKEEMQYYSLEHELSKQILQLDYFAPEGQKNTERMAAPTDRPW